MISTHANIETAERWIIISLLLVLVGGRQAAGAAYTGILGSALALSIAAISVAAWTFLYTLAATVKTWGGDRGE